MKYWKKSLLIIIVAVAGFVVLFSFSEGLSTFFIFPIIALVVFLSAYLIKQHQKDQEENIKKGFKYTAEDIEAEKWIETTLAPDTLSYIKTRHWTIIIYSFLFIIGISFLWSYLTGGVAFALQNLLYAALLFWLFVFYVMTAPLLFEKIYNSLPQRIKKHVHDDWVRGYLFLLPITYLVFLLSPYGNNSTELLNRLLSFPIFFIVYTFSFICLYCIIYLRQEGKKEEEKELKKSVKEFLEEEEN